MREEIRNGGGDGFRPIPEPSDVRPLPIRDPELKPAPENTVDDSGNVEEEKVEDDATDDTGTETETNS